jgi:hypothetical protein
MIVRAYTPEDFATVQAWAERRGCGLVPALLPPDGFVAESNGTPILTAWAAFAVACPIVYVDHVYLPRRFDLEEARKAWTMLIETIRNLAHERSKQTATSYLLIEIIMNPVMEQEAKAAGGIISAREYKKCHYLI